MNTKRHKKNKTLIGMTKNAFDLEGNIRNLKEQINIMLTIPSSFGYGLINVKKSLYFAEINSKNILFSKKDLSHIIEHISITKTVELLSNLNNNIVLGLDYYDKKTNSTRKCFILDSNDYIYLLSLRKSDINEFKITELTSLFYKGIINTYDIEFYLKSILDFRISNNVNYKNFIYKNKKSNGFLSRFLDSCKGVNNNSITKLIITHKNKKLSSDDI